MTVNLSPADAGLAAVRTIEVNRTGVDTHHATGAARFSTFSTFSNPDVCMLTTRLGQSPLDALAKHLPNPDCKEETP